jgi:hypothetical protein
MSPFWTACGHQHLTRNERGWLVASPDYWRLWLQRPEMALVAESCKAEKRLHAALMEAPNRQVTPADYKYFKDDDVRENYKLFLRFRDEVEAAGSLEAAYMGWIQSGNIQLPPLFIDLVVQAIVCNVLSGEDDAWVWRAAELLFRRQRITVRDGRVLSGDSDTLDTLQATGGLGEVGRLLLEGGAALKSVDVKVLHKDNEERYLAQREGLGRYAFLLDLTHEIQNDARASKRWRSCWPAGCATLWASRCRSNRCKKWTTPLGAGMWGWMSQPRPCSMICTKARSLRPRVSSS